MTNGQVACTIHTLDKKMILGRMERDDARFLSHCAKWQFKAYKSFIWRMLHLVFSDYE